MADKEANKQESGKIEEEKIDANVQKSADNKLNDNEKGKEHEHHHEDASEHKHEIEKDNKKDGGKPVSAKKKEEAVASGLDAHLSKKHCMYICSFIKGRTIDESMQRLNEVIKFKRAIPFKGEIPHRSQPGIMSGRYPIKASRYFISLLKGLKGNAIQNGLDLDRTRICFGSANWASRPGKSGGTRAKRTHITLKAREVQEKQKGEKQEKREQ